MAIEKLPHFRSTKAATKNWEPIYKNLFQVIIIPPAAVGSNELLLEHIQGISGLETDLGTTPVKQKYYFAERTYAGGAPEKTSVELEIKFSLNLNDSNEFYIYKQLQTWWRLVYNPLTGERGLKADYSGDAKIIVSSYNRKGDIFWTRVFNSIVPSGNIPTLDPDFTAAEAFEEISLKFSADWWDETMV